MTETGAGVPVMVVPMDRDRLVRHDVAAECDSPTMISPAVLAKLVNNEMARLQAENAKLKEENDMLRKKVRELECTIDYNYKNYN